MAQEEMGLNDYVRVCKRSSISNGYNAGDEGRIIDMDMNCFKVRLFKKKKDVTAWIHRSRLAKVIWS